jgi:hypothetical protein
MSYIFSLFFIVLTLSSLQFSWLCASFFLQILREEMGYLRKWFRPVRGVVKSKAMFVISPLRVTPSITPACFGASVIFTKVVGFCLRATI